jgi:epoxyqueuosine reductase QueG
MFKTEKISEAMSAAGFDSWGVVRITPSLLSDAKEHFEEWLAEGNADTLGYLHRNLDKRFAPEELMEGAVSIIVGAVSYKNELSMGYEADFDAKIASYA